MVRLLALDAAAMFVLDGVGRIVRENDPDRSDGPRLAVLGCAQGNLALARHDVGAADALIRIAEAAAPWFDAETLPACADELIARLSPVEAVSASLIFGLPHHAPANDPRIVRGDTATGARLLADFERGGVPAHLVEAGFVSRADFWAPWCAILEDGEIAAMAFAARLGDAAAEIGVYTFPSWRGHGLAAMATAAWSGMPALRDRQLFYSTLTTNAASRRVAARLGLPHIGMGLRIT